MDKELSLYIVCTTATSVLVFLSIFTFGFCIPIINDYKTQLDILKNKGCAVSYEEYVKWSREYEKDNEKYD